MTDIKLPQNTFILLATGEEAKTFFYANDKLTLDAHWTQGNMADEGPSGKRPPEESPQESMEATFSKQLAETLYSMAHSGKFETLAIIADPETLGEMRPLLHQEVTDKIVLELNKTLINSPTEDIEKTLAKAA
ncbi:host attachment family protein [Fretibacter rubidus]|uniref:host attachment family protein n=1 Tax=Fretibacter rubidus TaxID=570162 RepID=UPI00352B43D8